MTIAIFCSGFDPGVDADVTDTCRKIRGVHLREVPSRDESMLPSLDDAQTNGNRMRRERMIAGDHHGRHAGIEALCNRLGGFGSRRIDQTDEAQEREIDFDAVWLEEPRDMRPVATRDRQYAQTVGGHPLGLGGQMAPVNRLAAACPD